MSTRHNDTHPENSSGRPAGSRAAAWARRADEVERLVLTLGRMPCGDDTGVDARLLRWIRRQQWARRQDLLHPPEDHRLRLSRQREERLNEIPGWIWEPRVEQWWARAADVESFIRQYGRLPSARMALDDSSERLLAYWLENQRRKIPGQLAPEQTEGLSALSALVAELQNGEILP